MPCWVVLHQVLHILACSWLSRVTSRGVSVVFYDLLWIVWGNKHIWPDRVCVVVVVVVLLYLPSLFVIVLCYVCSRRGLVVMIMSACCSIQSLWQVACGCLCYCMHLPLTVCSSFSFYVRIYDICFLIWFIISIPKQCARKNVFNDTSSDYLHKDNVYETCFAWLLLLCLLIATARL